MFDFRLRAFEPNGDALGLLPEPLSVTASFVHNDDGALRVEYSTLAAGGPILGRGLEQGLEVAVEVPMGSAGWVEPVNARFLLLGRDLDSADAAGKLSLTLPSYGWLLRKARNLETANLLPEDHNQAGKRAFLSASAGVILGTLLLENAGRSGIVLGRGFTSARDSANAAWSKIATLYYDLGIDLWTVLNNLALQGMADWRTQGRELLLYNPDTVCAPDVSSSVFLRLGRDVGEAPSSESLEEVVGRVLIRGEDGLTVSEDNPSAPSPWGTWEGFISQGGVADEGTARSLVQADLERGARVRGQYTRQLVGLERARHVPLVDYVPGSWITAPTTGTGERVRVQQITLTKDSNGVSGSVVLNDRVLDAELRRSRRVTGIVGGSMKDGGSGVRPSPEGPDKRTPAKPLGLVVASNAYIDKDGNPRGLIFAEWDPVSTATDGTLLEVASYDFAIRENVPGAPWKTVRSTDDTTVDYSPLPVGSEQLVRVRARGRYATTPGQWSNVMPVLVAEDTTPPPIPSDPVLSTKLGTVTVKWDGETDIGTQMPLDFDVVRVYQQGVEEPIGSLRETGGSDFLVVTGLVWGEPARFRFTSVDTSDNESEPTSWVSITPVGVVDEDLVETTIQDAIDDIEAQVNFAVDAANGKNTIYTGPNLPTAPSGGFIEGDTWFDTTSTTTTIKTWSGSAWEAQEIQAELGPGSVTSTHIADDAITTPKLAAGAVTANEIAADAVTAGKIATGSITAGDGVIASLDAGTISTGILDAARIGAQTITADKLLIGAGQNILPNTALEGDDNLNVPGWPDWTRNTSNGPQGQPSIWLQGQLNINSEPFRIEPGRWYHLQIYVRAQHPDTRFYVQVWGNGSNDDGVHANGASTANPYAVHNGLAPTTWGLFEGTIKIPSDMTEAVLRIYGNHDNSTGDVSGYQWFTGMALRPQASGTLIEDGAVTTDKVAANAITASEIATNAITAAKINAGAVTAVKIDADAVTAAKLDALAITAKHTITGATIRTGTSGRRIQLDNSIGIRGWNANNEITFQQNTSTGNFDIAGQVRFQNTFGTLRFGNNLMSGGSPAIRFDKTGSGYRYEAGIKIHGSGTGERLLVQAPTRTVDTAGARLELQTDGVARLMAAAGGGNYNPRLTISYDGGIFLGTDGATQNHPRLVLNVNGAFSVGSSGSSSYPRLFSGADARWYVGRSNSGRLEGNGGAGHWRGTGFHVHGWFDADSKAFNIPHPLDRERRLIHGSTESPVFGVEYNGTAALDENGYADIHLPDYFEALTHPEGRSIQLTGQGPEPVWIEDPISDGTFVAGGAPGQVVHWRVFASRADAWFDPEPVDPERGSQSIDDREDTLV